MLSIEISGVITKDGIRIAPTISISSEAADFAQKLLVKGPIISAQGMITAI